MNQRSNCRHPLDHRDFQICCHIECSTLTESSLRIWNSSAGFQSPPLALFSHSVSSNSLWPHGLQYTQLPCPSPSPRSCSNSCPLSRWCHSTILSSVIAFSSCLQSFPTLGSFLLSWLFTASGQSIGASAVVLPVDYSGLISFKIDWCDFFAVQGTLESSPTPLWYCISSLVLILLYGSTLTSIHDCWKNHSFDYISQSVQLLSHVRLYATPWITAR